MNRREGMRCYRCEGLLEQTAATTPSPAGEMTIWYRCPLCTQLYEAIFSTSSVYALASGGETEKVQPGDTLAVLSQCKRCGKLIQVVEAHTCTADILQASALDGGPALRVWTLGDYTLEYRTAQRHWRSLTDVGQNRARALFHCLLSSPGRMLGCEQVAVTLWPDLDARLASRHLDKAISSLRHLLEPGSSQTTPALLIEHTTLLLADQTRVWVDADAFEACLSRARRSPDPGQTEQLLEEALLLYGGDYLPDERVIPWVQARREALQRSWIGLLLELADLRIRRADQSSAIDILERLLAVDPTNEAAVQRLLILLVQAGWHEEATRVFQRFVTALRVAYNVAPLAETCALLPEKDS
jgi:DNA-binding SARP family transcriptional activator